MTSTGGPGSVPPRPEWRATLAALSMIFFILCLCVLVVAARGRGDGIAGGILRRFSDVPLLGRLVQPLLPSTPTLEAPVLDLAIPVEPLPASPTPTFPADYLVRPTNWPTTWPWPPRPLGQPPVVVPQVQPVATSAVQPAAAPPAPPAPGQAATVTPSDEQQRKTLEAPGGGAPG
jgi:hypothetical protein